MAVPRAIMTTIPSTIPRNAMRDVNSEAGDCHSSSASPTSANHTFENSEGFSAISISGKSYLVPVEGSILDMVYANSLEEDDETERNTPLFCGCCCDLLRACIAVDMVYIFLTLLMLLGYVMNFSLLNSIDLREVDDDDRIDEVLETLETRHHLIPIMIAKSGCGILFASIGIFGAAKFYKYLVLLATVWYCIDLVVSGIFMRWSDVVVAGFFAYPHCALFAALRSGTIAPTTYKSTERYCCCDIEE